MIILKHLTVERFRLLREINLHFPQRGSILIQGPNEAGKSALLESIYFALYGEPIAVIASDRSRRTLDDLVLYGASQAAVTLTVSIGVTEMTIMRSIERGKGQQVAVQVRRLGMPEEGPITRIATANERIIAELGRMDGETLRNSCFIEQKGLSRLEDLAGREREATIRKVLGLEKLQRLTEQFKLTPNDERMLLESTDRLKLSEIQARIPELSQQLGKIEAALDAITVCKDLAEIKQQEEDIAEQQLSLQQLRTKRAELKGRRNRIQQLLKAGSTLSEISAAYDAIAEARRELPELDTQIADLDRREREELPALEKRVNELSDLIRSFGTLERMSNDLLTTVGTIKQLEQEFKQYQEQERSNNELDEQIITTRLQLDQARQSLQESEARLQHLQELREHLIALHQAEEEYARLRKGNRPGGSSLVGDVESPLERNVQEAEQELLRAEAEAKQAEQQADPLEKRWRQLSIGRLLEEWQRVKGQSQTLTEVEQQVMAAYQSQERLTLTAVETRQAANRWLMICIGSGTIGLILAIGAFFAAPLLGSIFAAILGLIALLCLAGAGWSGFKYSQAHKSARIADQQMQEAINQVGRMVAAREMTMRAGADRDALARVEQEIRSLGGTVPRTREDAQYLLQQLAEEGSSAAQDRGENLVDVASVQRRLTEKRNAAAAARDSVDEKMEVLSARRKRLEHFEQQRKYEDRKDIEAALQIARLSIQDKQREIALLASQVGLPVPTFDTPSDASDSQSSTAQSHSLEEREIALADLRYGEQGTGKTAEQENASLDAESMSTAELVAQVKTYGEVLDTLLARRQNLMEQMEGFQARNPQRQIERAREQQLVLRTALQSLQDSLRERVKPLGVAFGQAAVSNAEAVARKQLESLHIILGNRLELQSRRTNYAAVLKDRQDSLSEHYNQLAKFSGSLGSWIVPPNPFAETLTALRNRCQQEVQDADENSILQELERLQLQERASLAKVDLCRQEIGEAQERIASMLLQRSRPPAKSYSEADIVAIWPLVGEYASDDRSQSSERVFGLTEEHSLLEQELQQLEQQELELSTQLHTGGAKLDLEQARLRHEQQERSYQTRKRGSLLVNATSERLLRKMLPRTEYYMQQILPLLTSGRYHDARLKTEEEEGSVSGGPFQLHVWDTGASEYLPKSLLSGGAADQLSLALRLAFAIAVLPRELAAAPGFVFLDEPLSSFDRRRTQALVDVVTGEILSQHFEQVLLVSHSGAFDPAMFPYHVYLEGGVIVESNLPVVPTFAAIGSNGHSEDNNESAGLATIPVSASIALES